MTDKPRIQIAGNANPALPTYSLDEAEALLERYPPGGSVPKTIGGLAKRHWARKAKGNAKPATAADDPDTDLVPEPKSHSEIWAKWNGRYPRGRGEGV